MVARIVRAVGAVLLGMVIATSLAAAPASAAYSYEWDEGVLSQGPIGGSFYCINTDYSEACFRPDGDVIYVLDLSSADHNSAVARWVTDYGRWGTCRNANGAGTWVTCNKNFKEGAQLGMVATQYDGTTDSWWGPETSREWIIT
ncbi:hypothetical protein GCM10023322_71250 [Rugosimonospora acidiphila]|uniref:Secreted protein n=1 Tax=Rugosimonospora acidiphila TaxID=556531 RepID=A0ABP9SM22_9ACTN